jgi:CHRD domain
MSSVRRVTILLIASVGVLLACVASASASAEISGRVFTVDLTGAAEVNADGVPNQGDPDGSGTATLSINPGTGEVCWTIEVADVDPILAAHIHVAPSTAPGPIVVHLDPDTGCTEAPIDQALALAIITDPSAYYVNVHNATYPAGALRGQLTFAR